MLVDFLDALGSVITFGYHFHFYLGAFYGISFTYHRTERTVTAEVGVSRHQHVTQINGIADVSVQWMYGLQETVHLLYGIGHEYRLEIIAVFQSAANAGGNGIYVFEYGAVFDTCHVVTYGSLDE